MEGLNETFQITLNKGTVLHSEKGSSRLLPGGLPGKGGPRDPGGVAG
jgi:hypothetical protein